MAVRSSLSSDNSSMTRVSILLSMALTQALSQACEFSGSSALSFLNVWEVRLRIFSIVPCSYFIYYKNAAKLHNFIAIHNHRNSWGTWLGSISKYSGLQTMMEQFGGLVPVQDLMFSLWVTTAIELQFFSNSRSLFFCSSTGDRASCFRVGSSFLRSHRFFRNASISSLALWGTSLGSTLSLARISSLSFFSLRDSMYQVSGLEISPQSKSGYSFMLSLSLLPMSQEDSKISLKSGSTTTRGWSLWSLNTRAHVASALRIGETMTRSTFTFFISSLHFSHCSLPSSVISQSSWSRLNFICRYQGESSNQWGFSEASKASLLFRVYQWMLQTDWACRIRQIRLGWSMRQTRYINNAADLTPAYQYSSGTHFCAGLKINSERRVSQNCHLVCAVEVEFFCILVAKIINIDENEETSRVCIQASKCRLQHRDQNQV